MVSLRFSSSRSSSISSLSQSYKDAMSSISGPGSVGGSASSSKESLSNDDSNDEENDTITANRVAQLVPKPKGSDVQKTDDELRLLAISTHMTELSYAISDIQTRIFEIQELRHKSHTSSDAEGTTNIIDESLMNLDERLESVAQGMKSIADALALISPSASRQSAPTPTAASHYVAESSEESMLLLKHAALVSEWEAVQDESEILREELKEDKWLTVFRTVTDQADGMMTSLEKAVNRCQDFIWQVHRRGPDDSSSSLSNGNSSSDKPPLNLETFTALLESFEAKKKHYMPATSKVLSIIDKGVQDRVTKNGETLRRHSDSAQRWKNLRERIARTDKEMEAVRRLILYADATPSETESSTSGFTHSSSKHGFLATPSSTDSKSPRSRPRGVSGTMSRSISPFRKWAQKITRSPKPAETPLSKGKIVAPSSDPAPTTRTKHASLFPLRGTYDTVTPDRPKHKHTQSSASDSPLTTKQPDNYGTVRSTTPMKQKWNSSTKIFHENQASTSKGMTKSRRPSITTADIQSDSMGGSSHGHSPSRSSVASSRPWTPVNSSASTAPSNLSISVRRPPSRAARPPSRTARPPSRAMTPSSAPRSRPKTPSSIPAPSHHFWATHSQDGSDEEGPTSIMQRTFTSSTPASPESNPTSPSTSHALRSIPPRPPSRSMIPVPSLQFSSASRPPSAMSNHSERFGTSSFRSTASRAQTPEPALRARVQQVPFYQGSTRTVPRPLMSSKSLPPSSFKESTLSINTTSPPSRPGSRVGMAAASFQDHLHEYHPSNPNDPLDVEVANVVNSLAHGLLVERVDPPLRTPHKEGEEIRAQYAFTNSITRKVVTCRLTTLTRVARGGGQETSTKKVMCRVGGGWQDLQLYVLNRQAGL